MVHDKQHLGVPTTGKRRERKGSRRELPSTAGEQQGVKRVKRIAYSIMQFEVPLWELWHLSLLQGLAITVPI